MSAAGPTTGGPVEVLDLRDPVTASDLLALQREAYAAEAALVGDDRIPPLHETIEELVARPLEWRGVRVGGRVVAAVAFTGQGRTCDVDRLVVLPAHARRGLGRRLVACLLHHHTVTVSTAEANAPARALYEQLGFVLTGTSEPVAGLRTVQYRYTNTGAAWSFDGVPDLYERARPPYPDGLWPALESHAGPLRDEHVLELGAGPGLATVPMLDRGARVTAVEPGEQLAARLAANTAGRPCRIVRARFEDVADDDLDAPFAVAAAATSFHWIDAASAVPRLATLLRPGGHLAVWWNVHRGLADEDDPVHEALDPIHARFQTRSRRSSTTHAFDRAARVAELEAGAWFEVVAHERIGWTWTHDAASLRELYASFSDWLTVPEPDRTHALDAIAAVVDERFGGHVTRRYSTVLFVARRRDRSSVSRVRR